MDEQEIAEATKAIGMMLRAFPSSQSSITADSASIYRFAIEDFSLEAVKRACRMIVKGDVPGRNNSFAPSAPELSEICKLAEGRIKVENYEAERQFVAIGSPLWQQICILRGAMSLPSSSRGGVEGWLFTKDEVAQAAHVALPAPVSDGQQQVNAVRAKQLIAKTGAKFSVGDPDGNVDAGEAA